jgi:hypothetical protein
MRKEKLRRHWMDRPPLPTSPVPCDDIVMRFDWGVVTYESAKLDAEISMDLYDRMPRDVRDRDKEDWA